MIHITAGLATVSQPHFGVPRRLSDTALHLRRPATPAAADDALNNQLLAALSTADRLRWLSHLVPVDLPLGKVLQESGSIPTHVYFPTTAIVSLQHQLENGGTAECAMTGRDGMVGMSLLLGAQSSTLRSVVRSAGRGYRLNASVLQQACDCPGPVLRLLLGFTQTMITQIAVTALCNRHHLLDQQLCRWLLRSLDLLSCNELALTHELIANTLGVRREGVTEAAGRLHRAGLITYHRGHMTVLDRPGLEQRSCACYAAAKTERHQPQRAGMVG